MSSGFEQFLANANRLAKEHIINHHKDDLKNDNGEAIRILNNFKKVYDALKEHPSPDYNFIYQIQIETEIKNHSWAVVLIHSFLTEEEKWPESGVIVHSDNYVIVIDLSLRGTFLKP